ncbi:endopeptidase La [Gordonia sp. (in: high G+C Gram-positive bacteria)]|uniref:endopeptidase La n=1 Tax=Gordonia sp. (in: high G+C Gram-positive bacteria) TaxID=84139 RepID=UPI003F9CC9D2
MSENISVPVLFVPDLIVLPGMVVPVPLDDAAQAAVDAARASDAGKILIAPRLDDRYPTHGVLATIVQVGRVAGQEQYVAVVRGEQRAHIGTGTTGPGAALWVGVDPIDDVTVTEQTKELADDYRKVVLAMLQRREAWQVIDAVNKLTEPSALADTAGYSSWLSNERKRELLETADVDERLRLLIGWTNEHLAETEVSDKIASEVRDGMEKAQKEFLLRQQLNAIRKELGEDEPDGADDYRGRVEAADLPENVREAAIREVGKLESSTDQSPEAGWIRTWLDTVLDLPWNTTTVDSTDLAGAREILDADHHGLDDVKDRIVEYLAVRSRRAQRGLSVVGGRGSGAVMVLAGPPGVGKTSLGESVARALGRKFVRVALGGVRDEAEIRGHRRTYVGALPGRIVRAIGEAGSMNPVVLLDEIDKVGSDYRGDPSAALLEVLDPAQNHTFRDHYLDLDLDLSDVVFLATANVVENIPSALLDRMELVTIDGYTEDDKVAIARDYLVPRQRERAALAADEVVITDDALHAIAANYTREPGMRQFERFVAKTLRKVAVKDSEESPGSGDSGVGGLITVDADDLVDYLGRPRFTPETAERTEVPGVATGLAVTGMGGDVLFIEALKAAPTGDKATGPQLKLTGQLGDVMKESAQIALSYVHAHAVDFGIDPASLNGTVHIHFPAGAVPKDGPSAGVTMVTALVSMLSGRRVRSDVGMTGEVTLNGRVLPIGGVKQKLLAAQRNGLNTVFIPQRNEPDLDDVPAEVLDALDVKPMTDVAEIVAQALEDVVDDAAVVNDAAGVNEAA